MLIGDKNLKDSSKDFVKDTSSLSIPYKTKGPNLVSYTKTNKLITALYMVTDIMDKEEPIRIKLRSLGTEIISDIHCIPSNTEGKIVEVVSFLGIASAMSFISEMNYVILKKEFLELGRSIQERIDVEPKLLTEFLKEELPFSDLSKRVLDKDGKGNHKGHAKILNGHQSRTRIGVQKGSTLMKALSDATFVHSINEYVSSNNTSKTEVAGGIRNNFDILKKQRRNEIIDIIKTIGGTATIKDIKDKVQVLPEKSGSLIFCSEKTLQRELMSMTKDNVLNKTGEKRWSRYQLRINN